MIFWNAGHLPTKHWPNHTRPLSGIDAADPIALTTIDHLKGNSISLQCMDHVWVIAHYGYQQEYSSFCQEVAWYPAGGAHQSGHAGSRKPFSVIEIICCKQTYSFFVYEVEDCRRTQGTLEIPVFHLYRDRFPNVGGVRKLTLIIQDPRKSQSCNRVAGGILFRRPHSLRLAQGIRI